MGNQPIQNQPAPLITPGKWALYILVSGIPLVGLIMLLVWAFSNDDKPTRKNWAKGMLLIWVIIIIIYILLFFFIGGTAFLGDLSTEY